MVARRLSQPIRLFLIAFALTVSASGQGNGQSPGAAEETWSAACSSKIAHPLYPLTALASGSTGSVTADVRVAAGKAAEVKLTGTAAFADAVRAAVESTTFPEACSGRTLNIQFTFQLEGAQTAQRYLSVCFSHRPIAFSITVGGTKLVCSHFVYEGALVGPNGLAPITVCELLSNPMAFAGKNVALLGRLDESHFDGSWLSEDNCASKLISGRHEWPNRVWIASGEIGPDPPTGLLVLDASALERKLESVRKTTFLKMEELVFFGNKGRETGLMQQQWAVIFGRIEARKQLRPPSGDQPRDWGNGFGQMNIAPAQIVSKQENAFYIRENSPPK